MSKFLKLVYVWVAFATVIDLMTLLTPDVKQETKQRAAAFGVFNCFYMLLRYSATWKNEEEQSSKAKKPPQA